MTPPELRDQLRTQLEDILTPPFIETRDEAMLRIAVAQVAALVAINDSLQALRQTLRQQ